MKKRFGIKKQLLAFWLAVVLLTLSVPAAFAADPNSVPGMYVHQEASNTCTLAAAAAMLRRRAYDDNIPDWQSITEASLRSVAWQEGVGLRHSFSYRNMDVGYADLAAGDHTDLLIDVLAQHPEGIVLFSRTKHHAVLLTDYTDGVFYVADPGRMVVDRVPISADNKVSIQNAEAYWYVARDGNKVLPPIEAAKGITSMNVRYPENVKKGSPFSLKGKLYASEGAVLVSASVSIRNIWGSTVLSASADLGSGKAVWDIYEIDRQIPFGTLPVGSYTFCIDAKDSAGEKLMIRERFCVSSGETVSLGWGRMDALGIEMLTRQSHHRDQIINWFENMLS